MVGSLTWSIRPTHYRKVVGSNLPVFYKSHVQAYDVLDTIYMYIYIYIYIYIIIIYIYVYIPLIELIPNKKTLN